jgi:predicted  nucleic acid-binding Zn-ribbon protein
MVKNQLELLVLYQDINLMFQEAEIEEEKIGFKMGGKEQLLKARDELASKIKTVHLRTFKRLSTRYKRVIVPVQDGVCLGCFAKLPTAFSLRGRKDQNIMTCEQCGRILYWVE